MAILKPLPKIDVFTPTLFIRGELSNYILDEDFDEIEATDSRVLALNWITDKDQAKLLETDTNLFQKIKGDKFIVKYDSLGNLLWNFSFQTPL